MHQFESRLLAAISVAVLVVSILSLTLWKIADDASRSAQWVTHTHELLNLLARTRSDTLQIELATQNYRLTGEADHLVERDAAITAREKALHDIQQLISDNPQQKQRLIALRQVVSQRLALSHEIERLRSTGGETAANALFSLVKETLKASRERIYRVLSEMDETERELLVYRESKYERTRQLLVWLGSITGLLLCLLLTGTYGLVRRHWRLAQAHQRALADSEDRLATTLQSIAEAVLATDTSGRITRINVMAEKMTGWAPEEAWGRPIEEVISFINEITREPVTHPVAVALETRDTHLFADQLLMVTRQSNEMAVSGSAAPICSQSGRVHGVVLVLRDVTIERQAAKYILEQNALLTQNVDTQTSQRLETEGHLRNVINSVPALIAYVNVKQQYVYVNDQYQNRFAAQYTDIAGHTVHEVLGDERYTIASQMIDKVLAGENQSYDWQPFPGIWQNIRYIPKFISDGKVDGYYVLGTDITERKLFEDQIQSLNFELEQRILELEHVTRALRTLSAGNRAMLRASDESVLLDSMCGAITQEGGYDMAIIWYCDDDPNSLIRPMAQRGFPGGMEALNKLQQRLTDSAQVGQSVTPRAIRTGEVQLQRNMPLDPNHASWRDQLHGTTSSLACPLVVEGRVIGALTIYDAELNAFAPDEVTLLTESSEDLAFGITTLRVQAERERSRTAMQHMMRYDSLTGLANAFQFEQTLTTAISVSTQQEQPLAILQFNIERLSEINDAFGFSHGDQVLCDFGQRIQESVSQPAMIARVRGDEFALLLENGDIQVAIDTVERIEQSLLKPFSVADITLEVSVKAGIALFPQHGQTAHDLLRCVDKAVHQAKKKNSSFAIYEQGKPQAEATRLTMVAELRRAIERSELRLYLQPKVALVSGAVCGAEALVRWEHPQRGLLMPGVFIELAEQTGLIRPLTEWVIDASLDQIQAWQAKHKQIPIAVNFSARNLHDGTLLKKLLHWQNTRAIKPGLLELELTESSIMENANVALDLLYQMKGYGIPLYIDDFGTGYSSLSYLQKLPVDYIKIDQSFVSNMSNNDNSAMIVRSTIDLVKNLGRQTVAEGVETVEHWQTLRKLGCDYAQGYLIAKPMPAASFLAWAESFTVEQFLREKASH